jgi:methionine-rich copper-binding protein CopC
MWCIRRQKTLEKRFFSVRPDSCLLFRSVFSFIPDAGLRIWSFCRYLFWRLAVVRCVWLRGGDSSRFSGFPGVLLILLLAWFLGGEGKMGTAAAQAIVLEAVPPAGASIANGPVDVILRFNCRIDASRSRLTLIDSSGRRYNLPVTPLRHPALLRGRGDISTPGTYRLEWQVLSVDGLISRGESSFRLGRENK